MCRDSYAKVSKAVNRESTENENQDRSEPGTGPSHTFNTTSKYEKYK
jgi:hypothetical protein